MRKEINANMRIEKMNLKLKPYQFDIGFNGSFSIPMLNIFNFPIQPKNYEKMKSNM